MAGRRPSRKQARRDAAFVLYQHEVTGLAVEHLLAERARSEGYEVDEFTRHVVVGVQAHRGELDDELNANSPSWPLARIAPLERSILRLALFELHSGETPPEVAIDEAVRLTKRYSTDEAGGLVNGILAGVLRSREAGGPGDEPRSGEEATA